jgi:hypothetical protein
MDRMSEMLIDKPELFQGLDDPAESGAENDARFFFANMFLGILEEAHTQWAVEKSMPDDDWSAWAATAETFLMRPYFIGYWQRVHQTYEPAFQRFVDKRLDGEP